MSREILLTQGYVALVDDEDYEELAQYKWFAKRHGRTVYACHSTYIDGKVGRWYMHKQITGYTRTDHKNGDGLDNRRANLRPASHAQNCRNKRASKGGSSRYLGVHWRADSHKWRAEIRMNGKNKRLGCYESEEDAARAYDKAALERDPEFCRLNFPQESD